MRGNLLTKPKWFHPSKSSSEIFVGKNIVNIHDGDAIDHSLNCDGRNDLKRGHREIGQGVVRSERGGFNLHSNNRDDNDPESDHRQKQEGKHKNTTRRQTFVGGKRDGTSSSSLLNMERKKIVDGLATTNFCTSAASRAGLLTNERDCLDNTFDGIELFTCKEATGELFPPGFESDDKQKQEGKHKKTTKGQTSRGGKQERASSLSLLKGERKNIVESLATTNLCISAASRAGLLTNKRDCLDDTFDGVERFACKEATGELFLARVRPPSPIYFLEHRPRLDKSSKGPDVEGTHDDGQVKIIRVIGNDAEKDESDSPEGIRNNFPKRGRSRDVAFGGEGDDESEIPDDAALAENKSLTTTLDTSDTETRESESNCEHHLCLDQAMPCNLHQQSTIDSCINPINSGSSLSDLEAGERIISISPSLQSTRDRLEQLRQNKRDIETRVSRNRQTIVIPRSSVYPNEEMEAASVENTEQPKSSVPIRKLGVGSSVSTGQQKKFDRRKMIVLVVTILLILVALLILAMGLFWPAKLL